jgi:hypothetical protein
LVKVALPAVTGSCETARVQGERLESEKFEHWGACHLKTNAGLNGLELVQQKQRLRERSSAGMVLSRRVTLQCHLSVFGS